MGEECACELVERSKGCRTRRRPAGEHPGGGAKALASQALSLAACGHGAGRGWVCWQPSASWSSPGRDNADPPELPPGLSVADQIKGSPTFRKAPSVMPPGLAP